MKKPTVGAVGQEFMSSPIVGDASQASNRVLDSKSLSILNSEPGQDRTHSRQSQKTKPNTNGHGFGETAQHRASVYSAGGPHNLNEFRGSRGLPYKSGPKTPCPSCSRNTDSKCRWSETTITCYPGQSFGPRVHTPGDTINVNGVLWALVRKNGGFSGQHYVFKLDRGKQERRANQQQPRRLASHVRKNIESCKRYIHNVVLEAQAALEFTEDHWHLIEAPEVGLGFELIDWAHAQLAVCIDRLQIDYLDWSAHIAVLRKIQQAVAEHRQDSLKFRRDYLGECV